jgi:hypothetical protein
MPTIGQLPPASSVADTDELPIYQNGQTLAATRAQVLAGVQPALSLPQNTLLGGVGPGNAAPVPITIGANLAIAGSTLSATATPFQIPTLATGTPPGANDIVPLGQSGNNVGVSYANFLGAMGNVAGVPGGALIATAAGAMTARTLDALAANAVAIEDFGAKGDGVTDDGPALLAAIASGNPVRFRPVTYAIAGECDITGSRVTMIGVPGQTVLLRSAQSKLGNAPAATWLSFGTATVFLDGVIFDANTTITANTSAVLIEANCTRSVITRCVFRNAQNANGSSGLTYVASDPAITEHDIDHCEFTGNSSNGLYVQALDYISITNCRAHDNSGNGIQIDSQDPTFTLKIRGPVVANNTCWNNICGIIVGNFNATNTAPVVYGNANPDVLGALVASNNCFSNREYGIYISGRNILVTGNLCTNNSAVTGSGAGILCDTGYCKIIGNMVNGASAFGIDCGGSVFTEVGNNYVNGSLVGINIGGGSNCTARDNFLQDCTGVGFSVQNVESDGFGNNFGIACNNLSIIGNWIYYSGNVIPILIRDAPQNLLVAENVIVGNSNANLTDAISPYTNAMIMRGNLLNMSSSWPANPVSVNGVYTLTVPDIVDRVSISQSSAPIESIVTLQMAQAEGQICFARVTNGGSGYTSATVDFSGAGTGATAIVWCSAGKVIGIQMSSFGSGYAAGTTATISGNGTGATATVQVGLPVLQNRELSIDCLTAVNFAAAGSAPAQSNWTGAPITIPAGATIDWVGNAGGWRAARFSQSDYVSPNGDGSLTLRTQSGDISMHPAGTGVLRILSDTESVGAVELIGRGSPLNTVSAPAGSTFRNLNGGVGSTFWVKQSGTNSANWVAVA